MKPADECEHEILNVEDIDWQSHYDAVLTLKCEDCGCKFRGVIKEF